MTYEKAITALADPTRQVLIELLRGGPQPVGHLARHVPVSRPAVSQPLKALSDAGRLAGEPRSARRPSRLVPSGWIPPRACFG